MGTNKKKKKRQKPSAFFDLNVCTEVLARAERSSFITTALQLGYSGIALNHVVKGPLSDAHLCKSRPFDLSTVSSAHAEAARFHWDVLGVPLSRRNFRLYDRLTVVLDTAIQASALNATNLVLRSYDLVAIRPTSQKVFEQACTHLEVDIISLDFLHRLPVRLKASSVQTAVERGVLFEVSLSGAFEDVKARRELFANAQILKNLTRGRNIVITSGARRAMDLRGPNDMANLGTMFGLSREAGQLSVSKNCEEAILRGLERKTMYKSAFSVEKIPTWEQKAGSDEPWFEVPKVWDPLSNTKTGLESLLPEKVKTFAAVEEDAHAVWQTEAETTRPGDSDGTDMPLAQIGSPKTGSHSTLSGDKEEGFLSINLSVAPTNFVVGGPKLNAGGGDRRKEKHLGKHKKRKRK